jgi:transposase
MDTIVERPAALDVHKAQVTACVRVANERGEREERIAEFPTTVHGLLALRDWLAGYQVQQVVMEATGVYWKAPWAILEDEFECLLVNARATSSRSRAARPMSPMPRGCAGWPRPGC